MHPRLTLGAPGIYHAPPERVRALTGVRMDVCAFVGVAPRGPARVRYPASAWAERPAHLPPAAGDVVLPSVAVPVESWDAYRRLFGGFEGPGLLPYAVASFFEQGGQRAYVVRIVHRYGDARDLAGVAQGAVPGASPRAGGELFLQARNEGAWGNRLRATLEFRTRPLAFHAAAPDRLAVTDEAALPAGSLLRLTLPAGSRLLRLVAAVDDEWRPDLRETLRVAYLEAAAPAAAERAEIVEGVLTIDDGDGRTEIHERLGFSPLHPRWMAAVLHRDSILAYPHASWMDDAVLPDDVALRSAPLRSAPQFACGRDRFHDIVPDDFFDAAWVPGDERPANGVHALVELSDLALLVAPDLYSPAPLVPRESVEEPISLAGPTFEPCFDLPAAARPHVPELICPDGLPPDPEGVVPDLEGLRLDPTLPTDREIIIGMQLQLVELAEQLRSLVVLLDVPPGLDHRQVLAWRARFGSDFAAAYHPWLEVARADDRRTTLIRINPAAVAAGIIARQERAFGVPHGPANVVAESVVNVAERLSPLQHDELHPLGVNVFLRERDGVRLTAGRTLSRHADYRQLSVRRLMTLLARTVEQQMQWTVFEPNNSLTRIDVRQALVAYLRQLYLANAFRGGNESEAFFVRCDEELNPTRIVDAGQLIAEVGFAPAEPLEFLVLRIVREGDGTLQVGG